MAFEEVIFEYLIQQEIRVEEKKSLAKTFKALDTNGDGILSKSEVSAVFTRYSSLQEWEIEGIFEKSKTTQQGPQSDLIDYSGKNKVLLTR